FSDRTQQVTPPPRSVTAAKELVRKPSLSPPRRKPGPSFRDADVRRYCHCLKSSMWGSNGSRLAPRWRPSDFLIGAGVVQSHQRVSSKSRRVRLKPGGSAVEDLDLVVEIDRPALVAEAAAIDRHGLDHGEDLSSRNETERCPRASGHPRQQPLAPKAE